MRQPQFADKCDKWEEMRSCGGDEVRRRLYSKIEKRVSCFSMFKDKIMQFMHPYCIKL